MNKATVKKLEKLHKGFKKHEEAIEQNFTAKQTAIVRYRIGAEDNALHELKDVAAHFKCSVSYITKVIRDVTDFITEMEKGRNVKKYPKQTRKNTPEAKEDGVKVAVMTAKIENGKVTVKCADPEVQKQVQADLQEMVDKTMRQGGCGECRACINNRRMELGQKAMKLQKQAEDKNFFAWMCVVVAFVIALITTVKLPVISDGMAAWLYGATALVAFVGLMKYIGSVSLTSKRNGLLEAVRNI